MAAFHYTKDSGNFPRSKVKWKSPFRFRSTGIVGITSGGGSDIPTGILGITSGGGPLNSVGIFRPKFVLPILRNRFIALLLFTYVGNAGKE